jgi:hypothetical protein
LKDLSAVGDERYETSGGLGVDEFLHSLGDARQALRVNLRERQQRYE